MDTLAALFFLALDTATAALRDVVRVFLDRRSYRAAERGVRFVPFEERAWFTSLPLSLQLHRRIQRAKHGDPFPPMQWKGVPMIKDPFDLALYSLLLWELKPATIIELGSRHGGSALWLADLILAMGIDGRIYSFDIDPSCVVARHERVSFDYADCNALSTFPRSRLEALPHPWLVIDDAHVNLPGVLGYFDEMSQPGDYLVVEDIIHIRRYRAFRRLALARQSRWLVDTHYTDRFGYNVTWNPNGYLKRV